MSLFAMIAVLSLAVALIFIVRFRHAYLTFLPIIILLFSLDNLNSLSWSSGYMLWGQVLFLSVLLFFTYLSIPIFSKSEDYRLLRFSTLFHSLAVYFFLYFFLKSATDQSLSSMTDGLLKASNITQPVIGDNSLILFVLLYVLALFTFFFIFFTIVRRLRYES